MSRGFRVGVAQAATNRRDVRKRSRRSSEVSAYFIELPGGFGWASGISPLRLVAACAAPTLWSRRGLAHLELAEQRTAVLERELDRDAAARLERLVRLHQHQ